MLIQMFDQKTDGSLCIKNVEDCGMCGMCHVMSERERERERERETVLFIPF